MDGVQVISKADGGGSPRLNAIFVHGLGGHPEDTWCHRNGFSWPDKLAEDMNGLAVYLIGYPADKTSWGSGWGIVEAATAVRDRLMSDPALGATKAPIVFICHSLGGLIVKQLIVRAASAGEQAKAFLDRVMGVVFLATPHGGSDLSSIASQFHWFVSETMRDLKADDPRLIELSNLYRDFICQDGRRIRHKVYYEKEPTSGVMVVGLGSASPGLPFTQLVPVERNHIEICKPPDRSDPVYVGVLSFLKKDALAPREPAQEKMTNVGMRVAQQEGVSLKSLLAILAETESPDIIEIEKWLPAKASNLRDLTARLNRPSNADPEVARLRKEASVALHEGLFEEADRRFARAEARDLSSLEYVEELLRQKRLSAAESRADRAAAAMLRVNPDAYRQAAAHYAEASRIVKDADTLKGHEYLRSQAESLIALGQEFVDNPALHEAIRLLASILAASNKSHDPLNWARTQNTLGRALYSLGDRESRTEKLRDAVRAYEEAIVAYSEVLKVQPEERVQLDWAETQNNLGVALASLGERETGPGKLIEALAAYREALKVRTQERVPLAWAMTQNNLGAALMILGERESETENLNAAVAAYHEALKEWTRTSAPLQWAGTQMNLGNALLRLGEREIGTEKLVEAVAAYREALKEWTRERVPLQWAMAQNSLGAALSTLGERESSTARLDEAVSAYREALKETTRDRVPLDWATTQVGLGAALTVLGGTENLKEAVTAIRDALEESPRERVPLAWARAQKSLGTALLGLSELEEGNEKLDDAVKAYRAALEEWTRESVPQSWAEAKMSLGNALLKLGERESGTEKLDEAIAAYRAALTEWTRERFPLQWVMSTGNQGVAMKHLADRTKDEKMIEMALQQIEEAFNVAQTGHKSAAAYYEEQLPQARAILNRLQAR